ncbi:hypothetical protein DDL35_07150 [Staphylococcus aureus]|uniref:hypothetical protein n=1 Tax=Staphylococcus aureus TaxID=1280 RepID=UPI000D56ED05|nr:hypothetical protein [Staphylococcus aureus]PVV97547.1 hypothetical protein DDL35_07150 [Staphylococcus aureus]
MRTKSKYNGTTTSEFYCLLNHNGGATMPLFLQPILKTKLWGGQRLCIVIPNFQLIKLYTRNLQ